MPRFIDQELRLLELQKECDRFLIEKDMLIQTRKDKKRKIRKIKRKIQICIKARDILIETSQMVQKKFKSRVESLITKAIQTVYDYPYTFELRFKQSRNTIEAIPIVKKGGTKLLPEDDMGGGILDIISLGFRIILWYLQDPQSRGILFLDEPLRFLGNLSGKAGYMLKYLSKHFGIQIIMATHDPKLIKICDRAYNISHNGTESVIKREIKRR